MPHVRNRRKKLKVVAVIPARYGATRFPGKPLAPIAGKAMIQRVFEQAQQAKSLARVLVATDDERILQAVAAFGGDAVMTRADHRSGTERMAEVAVQIAADAYVNVQGDEPLIDPAAIDAAVGALCEDAAVNTSTISVPIRNPADIMDPNVVKVVVDFQGDALYFSRAPIPWVRDDSLRLEAQHAKHLGLYVFRRDALIEFPTLPPGQWEKLEQLEQLRLLENGYKIRVVETEQDSVSVDVPADVARVEEILATQGS
jgi:3-deoxy-manno-octulosonate cytidylyltransferase (CMP-KDO synthetase)